MRQKILSFFWLQNLAIPSRVNSLRPRNLHRQSSLNRPLVEAHDVFEEHDGLVGLGQEGNVTLGVVDRPLNDGVVRPHR